MGSMDERSDGRVYAIVTSRRIGGGGVGISYHDTVSKANSRSSFMS